MKSGDELPWWDAGLVEYDRALQLQQEVLQEVLHTGGDGVILSLQHPPVLTLGKNAAEKFLLSDSGILESQGIAVARTDRGGEITAHNPGQLVIYPILAVARLGLGARGLVEILEQACIRLLAEYGLRASTDPANPGVWISGQKIASVGVRIKQRISTHGLALNVSNDLSIFDHIVPCGLVGRQVTSMEKILKKAPSVDLVSQQLRQQFAALLNRPLCLTNGTSPLQIGGGDRMISYQSRDR